MITKRSQQLYDKACEELSLINQTLLKSENDSIAFLICHEMKECMCDFLQCFLMMKKGKLNRIKNTADLINQCAELDKRFKNIDLRWINCKDLDLKTDADMLCTSTERVQVCAIITNGIKKLVDDEIRKLSEVHA